MPKLKNSNATFLMIFKQCVIVLQRRQILLVIRKAEVKGCENPDQNVPKRKQIISILAPNVFLELWMIIRLSNSQQYTLWQMSIFCLKSQFCYPNCLMDSGLHIPDSQNVSKKSIFRKMNKHIV